MPTIPVNISDLAMQGLQEEANRQNSRNSLEDSEALKASDILQQHVNRISRRYESAATQASKQTLIAKLEAAPQALKDQIAAITLPEPEKPTRPERPERPKKE